MTLILHQIKSSKLNFLQSSSGEYTPPPQIVILPKSPIVGRDGRTFSYNTQEVLDNFIENQADLPIDIEHATEINAPKGIYSGAVGFVKSIQAGPDGEVIANIEWNNTWELSSKAYKYYSPAFEVDDENKVIRLTSVGLTNRPNFKIPALNSRKTNSINSNKTGGNKLGKHLKRVLNSKKARNGEEIEEEVLIEEIKDILDLPEDASLNEVLEEVAEIVDENEELKDEVSSNSKNSEDGIPASILTALDLSEDASLADVIEAIKKLKDDDSGSDTATNSKSTKALNHEVKRLSKELNSLHAKNLIDRKTRVLNSAIADGKISPATRKTFEISLNSIEALDAFEKEMEKAPSMFSTSIKKPAGFDSSMGSLNSKEKEWCKRNSITEKDYIATRSKMLGN